MRCITVHNSIYMAAPHFGNCHGCEVDAKHAYQTAKLQERMLKNVQFLLKKSTDPYGLLKDRQLLEIMTRMISANQHIRPGVQEVINSKFLQKNINRYYEDLSNIKRKPK